MKNYKNYGLVEKDVHKAIMQYLNTKPGLKALTFKNTGTFNKKAKSFVKSSNMTLGVADVIVFPKQDYTNPSCHISRAAFFLEIKKPLTPNSAAGKQSIHQLVFQKEMESLGYEYYLVYSVEDVQNILEHRGIA